MPGHTSGQLIEFEGRQPQIGERVWIAGGASVIGQVSIGPDSSIWFNTVLRCEAESITMGSGSNLQDGVVVHADPGFPVLIGDGVSVGHRAVLHGCRIFDDVLIGMGAVVLNGAQVGSGSLIAAGAVVLEGTVVPERSLVAGVPGRVRRPLTDDEVARVRRNATHYVELSHRYTAGLAGPAAEA